MEFRFTIALIYDFDGTLAPGNMQEYDFIPAVGKSNKEFWTEANTLAEEQDADMVLTYMARMLQEAKSKWLSLRREAFQDSGRRVTLYKGVKEWFARINAYGAAHGIRILHYINSSGMKEIIEGTQIAHEFRKIYACSFLYDVDGIAYWPAVAVNYTNKVLVDRIELVNGIKRVAVCSNPTTNLIRMDIGDNRINLTAQDIDFSVSANETISCSYDGEPISIGFKSTFLVEILSNMDTPTVMVELADSTRAGVFKPVYDDKQTSATLMLLMPMMINA